MGQYQREEERSDYGFQFWSCQRVGDKGMGVNEGVNKGGC